MVKRTDKTIYAENLNALHTLEPRTGMLIAAYRPDERSADVSLVAFASSIESLQRKLDALPNLTQGRLVFYWAESENDVRQFPHVFSQQLLWADLHKLGPSNTTETMLRALRSITKGRTGRPRSDTEASLIRGMKDDEHLEWKDIAIRMTRLRPREARRSSSTEWTVPQCKALYFKNKKARRARGDGSAAFSNRSIPASYLRQKK